MNVPLKLVKGGRGGREEEEEGEGSGGKKINA